MSRHDYMRRSGYAEDAYRDPDHAYKSDFVDAEGRRWSVTQTQGVRTIVRRKVESYVREVHGSRPNPTPTPTPTPTYSSSVTMGFPSKGGGALNNNDRPQAVNELLTKIFTEVNGSPRKISDPNPGPNWGRHSFPHEPPDREVNRRYGASPVKGDPINGPHVHASDPNQVRGRYSYPIREEIVYDYRDDPTYGSSPTKFGPAGGYEYDYNYVSSPRKPESTPSQQWGQSSSPVYDGLPQEGSGVPNPSSRNYQLPDDQWSNNPLKPQAQGFGVQDNRSPRTPNSSTDRQVQNNGWGGSPMRSHSPSGYGASSYNVYGVKPEEKKPREYKGPESNWGSPRMRDYGAPGNSWGNSSSPVHDHTQHKPGEQWEGSVISPRGYEKPTNQRENSSNPMYDNLRNSPSSPRNPVGSSPLKTWSHESYEVPPSQPSMPSKIAQNHPQNSPLGIENRWGIAPVKTHNARNYGTPGSQWDEASSPGYSPLGSNVSDPKDQGRRSLEETRSPQSYGGPSNPEGRLSTPIRNQDNTPSSPKNKWENSPMKIESSKGYGLPSPTKQWGRPSEDYGGPKDPSLVLRNQWDDRPPPSPVYDHWPNEEQYKPAHEVSYKDGVYTLNDKPMPKGITNNFPVNKPINYSNAQYGSQGLTPNPNSQVNPSGYNLVEALDQMNLDTKAPPTPAQVIESSWDIDSREAARRYGVHNIPSKPYQNVETQTKTITSKEALDKYNGSSVPKTK